MYTKKKKLRLEENHGIQDTLLKEPKANVI
jgi:hypothetical protein